MKLKGSFTLEGAVIFPMIAAITVGIVTLDYTLHDKLLGDVCKILGAVRYYEAENFCYDAAFDRINIKKIVSAPVIGGNRDYADTQKRTINNKCLNYYSQNKLGAEPHYTQTGIETVLDINSNAAVVRAGGKVVQVIGGD